MQWKNEQTVTNQIALAIHDALVDARMGEIHDILLVDTTAAIAHRIERLIMGRMHSGSFRRFYNTHQMLHWAATTLLDYQRKSYLEYEYRLAPNLTALVDTLENKHARHLADMSYAPVSLYIA